MRILTYSHGLHIQVDRGGIELQFTSADEVADADGRQHSYSEYVNIHRQECHFGGKRPVFICLSCRRQSFILYQRYGYYRCRTCCNLAHASQLECSHYRMINRAYKLLGRIHKDACLMLPIPEKPKGMHGYTYQRIVREVEHIRGNVGSVLNIRERFDDLFTNMPELEMLDITNFNLVDL